MIDPQIRVLLDAHLKQIEGLTHILGRVVTQQAELVRRLTAFEAHIERLEEDLPPERAPDSDDMRKPLPSLGP